MKNPFTLLSRLSLVLASALALGSCSRAQYATLPRSTPYLGSIPVATTAPVTTPAQAPATTSDEAEATVVLSAPLATEAVVVAKATPAPTAASAATQAATPVAAAPVKLNLVQRIALNKATKRINKLAASTPQLKQRNASASTTRGGLDERLRTAILLTLVAIVVGILAGVVNSNFIGVIAGVIFVVALIFLILYLIDQI